MAHHRFCNRNFRYGCKSTHAPRKTLGARGLHNRRAPNTWASWDKWSAKLGKKKTKLPIAIIASETAMA